MGTSEVKRKKDEFKQSHKKKNIYQIEQKSEKQIKMLGETQDESLLQSKKRKKIVIGSLVGILAVGCITTFFLYVKPNIRYTNAVAMMENHDFDMAKEQFTKISSFKDSEAKVTECDYLKAIDLCEERQFAQAVTIFETLTEYKDVAQRLVSAKYGQAEVLFEQGDYENVYTILDQIPEYSETDTLKQLTDFTIAVNEYEAGHYEASMKILCQITDYEGALSYIGKNAVSMAEKLEEDDYENRLAALYQAVALGSDISTEWEEQCQKVYDLASARFDEKKYGSAKDLYQLLAPYCYTDSVSKVSKCEMLIGTMESAYHGTWVCHSSGITLTFEEGVITYHTNSDKTEKELEEVTYEADENSYYFNAKGLFHTKLTGNTLVIKSDDGKSSTFKGNYQKYLDESHQTTLSNLKPIVVKQMED